ncbi:MAG: hypothetical protein R8K50_03530 [Mariprofundus sp.]
MRKLRTDNKGPFSFTETRYIAAVGGLVLAGLIWLASLAGLFTVPNGVLFDYLSMNRVAAADSQPGVLLLEVDAELRDAGDEPWIALLKALEQQGATQLLFTFMPASVSQEFYRSAQRTGKVLFGRRLHRPVGAASDEAAMEPMPDAARGMYLKFAAYAIAASEYGVYRKQAYAFPGQQQAVLPSLEALAAGVATDTLGAESFRVDFLEGGGGLPRIKARRVLGGELIPELVQGRRVLIGLADSGSALFTPLARSGHLLSELEFHGFALDTLLRERIIRTVPLWLALPLILLIIGISLFVSQWGGLRFSTGMTIVLLVCYGLLSWGALNVFRTWLPLAELWLAQLLTLLLFTRYRAVTEEAKLRKMLRETNAQMREYFGPASFASSGEHWSKIIIMVNQTLNLERMIFLEREEGDHRVREVKALNCKLQDITEMRRDFERTPYSTAIAEKQPIEVQGYLKAGREGEVQYLVPLLFAGEVMGFWAFTARREKLTAVHNRSVVLRDFAEQIAELLFHRQQAQAKEAMLANPLQRYLSLQGGEQVAEALAKTLTAMDHRLVGMEDYLDGLSTAGILYDLFGQVRVANRKMVQLLTQAGHLPSKMTAVDLIRSLGGVTLIHARELMETIILHRENISLPATLADDSHSYVLQLGPLLSVRERQIQHDGDIKPFEMEGILCELIDVTVNKRLSILKEDVVGRMTTQVRNDMASFNSDLSLLAASDIPASEQAGVVHHMREKIDNLVKVTEQAHALLTMEMDAGEVVERYPIDCKKPLLAAVETVRKNSDVRGIAYELELPELISLVFAAPDGLGLVLGGILELLVADSMQQGVIKITLEECDGWIIYRFSNQGFGMPGERFQNYLHGEDELSSDEFRKIRQSAIQVKHWDGMLEGYSELGEGTHFELKLRGFI